MKRARWAFILMSWGLALIAGFIVERGGWLGPIGVICLLAAGYINAAAMGVNFPKLLSNKWPNWYPPEKPCTHPDFRFKRQKDGSYIEVCTHCDAILGVKRETRP